MDTGALQDYEYRGKGFDDAQHRGAAYRREGLPLPVDEHGAELETRFDDLGQAHYYDQSGQKVERVLFAEAGHDGKPGAFAVGKRKGEALREAEQRWGQDASNQFEILEVAEDGRKLADELSDLSRDSASYEKGERVSHGAESEQAPDLILADCSDEEVDLKLQQYLKKENSK